MNFDLDADDRALQQGIRDLCRSDTVPDHPRAREAAGGVDRDTWRELGRAGVFALRLPESEGGVELGLTGAALVFEELGRALVPGPLVASHLAGGLVDGAAMGDRVVGLVERLPGTAIVEHLDALDVLVALDDDGLWSVAPGSFEAEPVGAPLDPLTPLHRVAELPMGEQIAGPEDASRWRLEGAVLTAAFATGIASAATDSAVAYAKEREQFGRPIGSFQAVKHLCADMLTRAEVGRAATYAAACAADDPAAAGDPGRAAASALLLSAEAAFVNGKDCIQVHGGMGFTWEANVHLYVKRAAILRTRFGGADAQAEAVTAPR
jgi:alkylation response protein AidB-like acyl-CoA dehydrogenase